MHHLIVSWFHLINDWGYLGVFLMMAVESSIVPLPSEVVVPPAAYYAAQGHFNMFLVVLSATAGSLFGSLIMYGVSRLLGRPFLMQFGRYVFLTPEKIAAGERFFLRYSNGGIFFCRLLPVIRHLSSIPAGLARMNIGAFSALTTLGAGLWCAILAWFGNNVIGDNPNLLNSPDELVLTLKRKLVWLVVAALVFLALYVVAIRISKKEA